MKRTLALPFRALWYLFMLVMFAVIIVLAALVCGYCWLDWRIVTLSARWAKARAKRKLIREIRRDFNL